MLGRRSWVICIGTIADCRSRGASATNSSRRTGETPPCRSSIWLGDRADADNFRIANVIELFRQNYERGR